MIWTAWKNGKHHSPGVSYGFKLKVQDRDQFFSRDWETITLILPSQFQDATVTVNVNKSSFWNDTCRELISQEIGKWLIDKNYAPWQKGKPPQFNVDLVGDRQFRVINIINS
ncbi:hypothetical protein [Spirosoma litoris]